MVAGETVPAGSPLNLLGFVFHALWALKPDFWHISITFESPIPDWLNLQIIPIDLKLRGCCDN